MSKPKIGDRVGVMLSSNEERKEVKFVGYGIYAADEVPSEDAGGFGSIIREEKMFNPKLQLDDGQIVWGCESWWGHEEAVKSKLEAYQKAGYNIINIKISDARLQQQEE